MLGQDQAMDQRRAKEDKHPAQVVASPRSEDKEMCCNLDNKRPKGGGDVAA